MSALIFSSGYVASAFIYTILSLLFSFVPNKNLVTRSLVFCCVCFLIWGAGSASILFISSESSSTFYALFESIRFVGLVTLLISLLSVNKSLTDVFRSPQFLFILVLLAISVAAFSLSNEFRQLGYTLFLVVIIFLLVLVETIFSKAKNKFWALKPMILCLFAMLIVDFILFAEGALFLQLETNLLTAKSYLNFLLAPLLLWSARRATELQVKVYVSREVVLQSTVVLGAGVYLGLLSLAGFYLRQFEETWSPILQIVFISLGFLLLIAIFLSHTLKTNLKIFIQKNFFANKFDYRVQWLTLTESLGKDGDVYENALNTTLLSMNAKAGLLIKLINEKPTIVGNHHVDNEAIVAKHAIDLIPLLQLEMEAKELVSLKEAEQLSELGLDIVVPIHDGTRLWGFSLLAQRKDEYISLDWEVGEYLHVVSIQVANYLYQHEANKLLMENAQFAAFSRMSAFVVHDLKNILAQIQMIVSNSAKHRHNEEFIDDTFETLVHSQTRLEKVIKQLKEKKVDNTGKLNFDAAIALKDAIDSRFDETDVIINSLPQRVMLNADEERFRNVICHIVDNGIQASSQQDKVSISMQVDYDTFTISIKDSGVGMSREFVQEKLFKPFETTKGNAGMGIGAYDAKVFAEELGGEIKVSSEVGKGSQFDLSFPLSKS